MNDTVEPCASCARHVRANEKHCPFCGAPHASTPAPAPPRAPTRAALAAWAGLFAAACGGGGDGTSGDEQVQGGGSSTTGDERVPDGASGGEGEQGGGEEVSCAGRCGSHHHPACMDDPVDPCPAPPYGAPPADLLV